MNYNNYPGRFPRLLVAALAGLFCLTGSRTAAQHFHFTQYNYSPLRLNPALVATQGEAMAIFHYRHQSTNTQVRFRSSMLTASYPVLQRATGEPLLGLGISALDDRTGADGMFTFQTLGINAAYRFRLNEHQGFALGLQGNYADRRISTDGLTTGSQYLTDRGYDPGADLREEFDPLRSQYFSLGAGAYWYQQDAFGLSRHYAGLSVYDLNQPAESFIRPGNVPATFIVHGGFRVVDQDRVTLTPQWLYSRSSGINYVNVGAQLGYGLAADWTGRLDFSARYVIGQSANLGMQLIQPRYLVGFSYDVPLGQANTNTFQSAAEVVFAYKLPVEAVQKKHKKKRKKKQKAFRKKKRTQKKKARHNLRKKRKAALAAKRRVTSVKTGKRTPTPRTVRPLVKDKAPADSLSGKPVGANPGPKEELTAPPPAPQDTVSLRDAYLTELLDNLKQENALKFRFNSNELAEESYPFLDALATFLTDNPAYRLRVVGHTDNVGNALYNQRLSLRRAQQVVHYLASKGVAPDRIQAEGKGEEQPLTPNQTEQQRAANRRVAIDIVK